MSRRLLAAAAGAALLAAPAAAQTIAIEGGTVHPVSGPAIPNGTVLLRDGRIVAVGANVAVPAGARRIDARGKWVTPGLFDSSTRLGLTEVGAVTETNDFRLQDDEDRVSAAFVVTDGLNPASFVLPAVRIHGVTTAVTHPAGGLVAGQGVVIDLDGSRMEDLLVRAPVAMYASVAEDARDDAGGSRPGIALRLREVLDDARLYPRVAAALERGETREMAVHRLDLAALQPVLRGELPLVVEAHRASDIRTVLRIAREYGVRVMILGGTEAWMVADELAAANVPVVTRVLTNLPDRFESLGARFDAAALLRQRGVTVAITSGETHKAANLRQEAGNAVAYGMSWDDALRSITLVPAQLWGVADRYGSLEPGKVANVVVWDGDPFELLTNPTHVFIRGREIPLVSRDTQLRDRYRNLDEARRSYGP